jgi:hypothetical protein
VCVCMCEKCEARKNLTQLFICFCFHLFSSNRSIRTLIQRCLPSTMSQMSKFHFTTFLNLFFSLLLFILLSALEQKGNFLIFSYWASKLKHTQKKFQSQSVVFFSLALSFYLFGRLRIMYVCELIAKQMKGCFNAYERERVPAVCALWSGIKFYWS